MSRIFKSVSLRETPLIIFSTPPRAPEPETVEEPILDEVLADPGDEILTAAGSEAIGIVSAARDKAAAVMTTAADEAAKLRREAYDEGYEKGFAEGQVRGEAAGLEQAKGAIEEAAAGAARMLALAQQQADAAFAAAERQVVELALAVAAKILGRQVEENPTVILPIVKAALDKVQDQEQIAIRVNPACYELVLAARPELQAALARANTVTVVADSALKEGDCIVETPFGTVDARIDTQLELVKAALRDLMP